ncbi:MAG TPA: hypothetical protein VGI32_10620 [Steroidobacteraceae bacterium]
MPASNDLAPWFKLQGLTLDAIHPSWFADLAPELVVEARKNFLCRRWLAIRLSTISPLLFGAPAPLRHAEAQPLQSAAWLEEALADTMDCAFDLGLLVLPGLVRTVVARADVMRLRSALGAARYERILKGQPDSLFRAHATGADIEPAIDGGAAVVERLTRRGAAELMGYAASVHPAWGESVRLCFERRASEVAPAPCLDPDVVEDCLRLRATVPEADLGETA